MLGFGASLWLCKNWPPLGLVGNKDSGWSVGWVGNIRSVGIWWHHIICHRILRPKILHSLCSTFFRNTAAVSLLVEGIFFIPSGDCTRMICDLKKRKVKRKKWHNTNQNLNNLSSVICVNSNTQRTPASSTKVLGSEDNLMMDPKLSEWHFQHFSQTAPALTELSESIQSDNHDTAKLKVSLWDPPFRQSK